MRGMSNNTNCQMICVDEHLPPKKQRNGEMHAYILLHKSSLINLVVCRYYSRKIFSCHFVESALKQHGHARQAFQEAEKMARKMKCHEIWYCTPLNPIVLKVLIPIGWEYTTKLAYDRRFKEWVTGLKKKLI